MNIQRGLEFVSLVFACFVICVLVAMFFVWLTDIYGKAVVGATAIALIFVFVFTIGAFLP